jgi:integrase
MASITKRPDGRWRARYRDAAGKEHAKHFTRKVDGQRWLDEVTAAVMTGQYVDPKAGRVTFAAYFSEWSARQVWAPNTVKAMQLAAESTTFADVPLARLRRSHRESWVKSMDSRGLAPGTIRTRVNNVRAVLRAAVRDRVIANDPSERLTLPRDRRREVAMTLPTTEEVASILGACAKSYRALVALAGFAGLRLGEAAGLQVGDVDFLRRSLTVRRQIQRLNGGDIDVRPPKYGSERTVFLADGLLAMLSAHIADHRPGEDPQRWLFATHTGQPPHQNTVGHFWRSACRDAGVEGLTLHDLRHFYASGLIAAGCDVVTVQRALGHAKATTTPNTYAYLWPTAEDRTRQAAEGLVRAALAAPADSWRTEPGA